MMERPTPAHYEFLLIGTRDYELLNRLQATQVSKLIHRLTQQGIYMLDVSEQLRTGYCVDLAKVLSTGAIKQDGVRKPVNIVAALLYLEVEIDLKALFRPSDFYSNWLADLSIQDFLMLYNLDYNNTMLATIVANRYRKWLLEDQDGHNHSDYEWFDDWNKLCKKLPRKLLIQLNVLLYEAPKCVTTILTTHTAMDITWQYPFRICDWNHNYNLYHYKTGIMFPINVKILETALDTYIVCREGANYYFAQRIYDNILGHEHPTIWTNGILMQVGKRTLYFAINDNLVYINTCVHFNMNVVYDQMVTDGANLLIGVNRRGIFKTEMPQWDKYQVGDTIECVWQQISDSYYCHVQLFVRNDIPYLCLQTNNVLRISTIGGVIMTEVAVTYIMMLDELDINGQTELVLFTQHGGSRLNFDTWNFESIPFPIVPYTSNGTANYVQWRFQMNLRSALRSISL